jgi:hypothetical protein
MCIIPFAIGNFLGPLIHGRLFDSVERKPMIARTLFGGSDAAAGQRKRAARRQRSSVRVP